MSGTTSGRMYRPLGETGNGAEDIWWILEGQDYPRLWWELGDETP